MSIPTMTHELEHLSANETADDLVIRQAFTAYEARLHRKECWQMAGSFVATFLLLVGVWTLIAEIAKAL